MKNLFLLLLFIAMPASAEPPRVVTDIAPVRGLVAQVMAGVGTPDLLVQPGISPHHYAMRPSEARMLAEADLVVWVGHGLTPWLEVALGTLAGQADLVELMVEPGVHLLPLREGGLFGGHDHAHGTDKEEDADPHVWLAPDNAVLFLDVIADALARRDPANAQIYLANADAGRASILQTKTQIESRLPPLRDRPFIVLHDGFHYFEAAFGIEAQGAIAGSDAETPGAARVAELRNRLQGIVCAFTEPQVGIGLLETVTEGMDVRIGTLDPLGAEFPPGPGYYEALLMAMADSMVACLTE